MRQINRHIKKRELLFNPLSLFILFSAVFGLLFIFIFPPLTAPDEIGHFSKSYAFSELKVVPEHHHLKKNHFKSWDNYGFYLPDDITDLNADVTGIVYNPKAHFDYKALSAPKYNSYKRVFIGLGGQLNYSFLQYIPQIIGIAVSKIFTGSIVISYYFARFFNLFFYIAVVALAIYYFKFSKWAAMLLGLNPMSLALASSASGDGFTNACSFLFIALLSKFITEDKLNKKLFICSLILLIALVQMKPTTIIFGLLYFIIPLRNLSLKNKLIYGTGTFLLAVGIYYVWGKLFPSQEIMYQDFTSSSQQTSAILENPINFLRIIKNTVVEHHKFLFRSFSGQFSALNRNLPMNILWVYYAVITVACFSSQDKIQLSISKRLTMLLALISYVLLTFVALFQIWTPVNSPVIIGLQGRYFIPTSLIYVMLVNWDKIRLNKKFIGILSVSTIAVLLSYTTFFLLKSYGYI